MDEIIVKNDDWYLMDTWNFNEALGDTIMEKYESLYVKLHDVGNKIGNLTRLICGPEVASIFETATSGFAPEPWPTNIKLCNIAFHKIGRINNKFDIYVDHRLKNNIYVIGDNGIRQLIIEDFPI